MHKPHNHGLGDDFTSFILVKMSKSPSFCPAFVQKKEAICPPCWTICPRLWTNFLPTVTLSLYLRVTVQHFVHHFVHQFVHLSRFCPPFVHQCPSGRTSAGQNCPAPSKPLPSLLSSGFCKAIFHDLLDKSGQILKTYTCIWTNCPAYLDKILHNY